MTRQTFGRWAFASATAILMLGCGQPPDQFIVIQNQVPDTGCVIPTTKGSTYRGSGVLDVRLVSAGAETAYAIYPLMQNNLPGPTGAQAGDPNRIALSGFKIDISLMDDAPDGALKDKFAAMATSGLNGAPDHRIAYSIPTSGSVESGGGNTSSGVNGLDGELALLIRDSGVLQVSGPFHIRSTIRAEGSTVTRSVTSDPFDFPILVCDGCLIANAVDRKVPVCPAASVANPGNECNVAQDESVDCCTTNGGQLVCPAVVAAQ
jgi:hypothetical protein